MDERLAKIEKEKQNAINTSNNTYNEMLNDNKALYEQQQSYIKEQENIQNQNLDKQLEFQKQQIEKQKQVANDNFKTESKKALNDFIGFTNPYGQNAEAMAESGLLNSGVSETSKLGGFNAYQNRLASANKAMQDAFTQYDTSLNEAILNNDVQKAENALERLKQSLAYTENFYNNKSTIAQSQLTNNQNLNSDYNNRYQTEYQNIQNEKARAEAIRQWNEDMEFQKKQAAQEQSNWEKQYALAKSNSSSSTSKSTSSKSTSTLSNGVSLNNGNSSSKIKTDYYSGDINPDCQYGTFETKDKNGVKYQPNNVDGNKLSSAKTNSGEIIKVGDVFGSKATGSTGANISGQKIWTTGNKYYFWDGSVNSYVDITNEVTAFNKRGYSSGDGRKG